MKRKSSGPLEGRTAVVGVTGSIAAYKSPELIRLLRKEGMQVETVLTEGGGKFIAPLTLSSVSGNRVHTSLFADDSTWDIKHVALAEKCDILIVAPATAGIISRFACGLASDLLSTLFLAMKCPVLIAPAMNDAMYSNPATANNIALLKSRGVFFAGPEEGLLASGRTGTGRMSDPRKIAEEAKNLLLPSSAKDFSGVRVLVSAGPTREPIDPVRFISNPSSGRMGYEIARAAVRRGAEVVIVSGPVNLPPVEGARTITAETALQMRESLLEHFDSAGVVVMCAAVSDYRPRKAETKKISGRGGSLSLELVENPDILKEMGGRKKDRVLVGFSMDAGDHEEKARKKAEEKNLDLIVANDISRPGAGFGTETNIVKFIDRKGSVKDIPLAPKSRIADLLLDEISGLIPGEKR